MRACDKPTAVSPSLNDLTDALDTLTRLFTGAVKTVIGHAQDINLQKPHVAREMGSANQRL